MKHCDGCGYAVERCTCPLVVPAHACGICTYQGRARELEIVEDKRGFIDYRRCKDRSACAKRCSEVDWSKI